jgi:hypothetical protein
MCVVFGVLLGCARPPPQVPSPGGERSSRFPSFPARPRAGASQGFWAHWSDGRAELSGYRATVNRYGELRPAEVVLVYVTEPMNRRTWIKDDDAAVHERVVVLKLNASLKFQTGVYPYSVLTSVFSPVERYRDEAFAPVKLSLSVQEWCGHVFQALWPGDDHFVSQTMSYFASEGETREEVRTPPGTLYEDALLLQLRELDGPFAGGRDWRGTIVPSLWSSRRAHRALRPVEASITRSTAERDGTPVTRFTLRYADVTRSYDVERALPHRVVAWSASDGEEARILGTERLPYWQLNRNGDERERRRFGLSPTSP